MSERMSEERLKELATAASRVIAEPQRHSASQWNAAKAVSECVCEIDALRAELAEAERNWAEQEKRGTIAQTDLNIALNKLAAAERERDRAREAIREALEYRAHLPIHVRLILDASKGEP